MRHSLKKSILALVVVFGLLAPLPAVAATGSNRDATCEGAQLADVEVDCTDKKLSDDQFGSVIKLVVNILSVIVGAVSVIMIIVGGFRYVISNGDSNALSGAKNTILYAIVGLVIVLFAQVLVRFILSNVAPD